MTFGLKFLPREEARREACRLGAGGTCYARDYPHIGAFAVTGLGEGEAAVLCIRRRAIRLGEAGRGRPGRVLHARFLGDQVALEIASTGL